MKYPAVYHEDGSILFPDLPGCTSRARSLEDAARRAQEAAETWLDGALEDGEPWPSPSESIVAHSGEIILWVDIDEVSLQAA